MKPRLLAAAALALALACAGPRAREGGGLVVLASTIGPIEAGIVPALEDRFEAETGIRVRHVGAGTGEALKIAQGGGVDLVLVHARALEEKFVADGFGTERIPLMYNDFVIVGPPADPAGIRGMPTAAQALQAIAAKQAPFVSRGDRSGTHVAELELWKQAGIQPAGAWYQVYEKGSQGNAATLGHADARRAYTVMDRATWLTAPERRAALAILVEKDEALLNHISVIPVNPARFPKANNAGAMAFVRWLTAADKGQAVIATYGKDRFGAPLFVPESKEWQAARK